MTSPTVLGLSLRYGAVVTGVVMLLGSIIGLVFAGPSGLVSALIGAAISAVFMALTALSILLAQRVAKGRSSGGRYFGIVISAWILKVLVFFVIALFVGRIEWLNPYLFFAAVVAAVMGSLVADGLAMQRAREPYVGDVVLPGDAEPQNLPPNSA